jgi:hypothetical protein
MLVRAGEAAQVTALAGTHTRDEETHWGGLLCRRRLLSKRGERTRGTRYRRDDQECLLTHWTPFVIRFEPPSNARAVFG